MPYALDYSAGHPPAAQVKAAGYVGVIRYIGFDPALRPKCIGRAEYADMAAGGVGVALVYENTAGDMLAGRAAGRTAAARARQWAGRIGFPASRPIYYACDTDIVSAAQFAAVLDYLRGCVDVEGDPGLVGVYGEHDVMEQAAAAGVARWYWQTRAWSHGVISGRAHLVQEIGTYTVGGVACDRNTIKAADWGQHNAAQQEEDMALTDPEIDRIVAAVWGRSHDWPPQWASLSSRTEWPMEDYAAGGSVHALRVLQAVQQVAVGQVAIKQAVGALSDDEAHLLAAVAASQLGLQDALEAAVQEITDGGATPNPGDPGFPAAVADAVMTRFRAAIDTSAPPQQ